MIRHLRKVDPGLASIYGARIDMIQGFVESAIRDYEALVLRRQQEAAEAAQKEQERQRLLAEEEARKKREEEERKAKVAEEEARMKREEEEKWLGLIVKVKQLAERDPDFLALSGLQLSSPRTTYPAVDGGKCEKCMSRNVVCLGVAGKTCAECARLHYACSNNTGTRTIFILFYFILF
jgi:hypothetical protein